MTLLKVLQLTDSYYSVFINTRQYLGSLDFIKDCFTNEGLSFSQNAEVVKIEAGIEKPICVHFYVEQGFRHSYIACKFCGEKSG